MSELPVGWEAGRFGDIVSIIRGVTFPASSKIYERSDDVIACLRTSHIQDKLTWDNIYFIPKHFVRKEEQITLRNDILMSMANSSNLVGKVCINESDSAACFGAFLAAIRCNEINFKYVYYFLRSADTQAKLRAGASQTVNIANISVNELEKLEIPLPPLAEQQRIAQKLDALLEKADTLKAGINAIAARLKKLRQSIVAAAVADQIAIEPRGNHGYSATGSKQAAVILEELCTLITSGSRGWGANYADSGAVFIRSQDINRDMLDLSGVAYVALPESSEGKRTRVKNQDILVTITGANVGKVARVTHEIPEAYVSQHVALIRLKDPTLAPLIEMYLKDVKTGRASLLDLAYGGGKPGLNLSNLRNLAVPATCIRNSAKIILRVEQFFAVADQLEAKVATARQRIDALTQSILAKAFRGELVPQDPNDEPASVLLERIRAQRAAAPKPKRGRKAAKN